MAHKMIVDVDIVQILAQANHTVKIDIITIDTYLIFNFNENMTNHCENAILFVYFSHTITGMWAHCMTTADYQDLIDRGTNFYRFYLHLFKSLKCL